MQPSASPLESILAAAVEIPSPAERSAYVERACAGDSELQRRVGQMIENHFRAGRFLEDPIAVAAPTMEQPALEAPGLQIGPYKLMEQIGEGGMGLVFVAEQHEPVRRKVALKVIKPGMDTRACIARFEAERQALALMDHPNIARVLDAGTTKSGRPFFVMELVKGVPITDYCDASRLMPRERLELFTHVCHAVQHAHQKGIIHRDIKPTNVLVTSHDGTPVVKVIDFGVAKAIGQQLTERTIYTALTQMVGTPLYMSPEQAGMSGLDVDTRTDIYSLGVLLYELLTGTTPFDKERLRQAAYDEMRRIIREEEPQKPSTRISTTDAAPSIAAHRSMEPAKLTKLVRGELDWIVMKALEKDRNRRYETANGFAMDIQRYLADEAVQACPPSVGYRLHKFVRRNKAGLAVSVLVLFFLVLLGSAVGWALRDRAAREADIARERETRQAKVAAQVQLILDEATRLQQEQKWPESLATAKRAEAVVAGGEANAILEQRVRQAVAGLKLVGRLEDIRLLRSELMKGNEPDFEHISELYAAAFRQYGVDVEKLPAEQAADALRLRSGLVLPLAQALDNWADCLGLAGDKQAAKKLWLLAAVVDPEPWRAQVRHAVADLDIAALLKLANSDAAERQPPASLVLLAEGLSHRHLSAAVALLQRASERYPGDFWIHFRLAGRYEDLGPKHLDAAIRHYVAARALRPRNEATWNNLGLCLHANGQFDEALSCFARALELDPESAAAYDSLAGTLSKSGKFDEANVNHRKAIALDPKSARAHCNFGVTLSRQNRLDEAIACYRKAIELAPGLAQAHYNLGADLYVQKKFAEAIACCRKAIEINPQYVSAYVTLGNALAMQGSLDEAIAFHRKALELEPNNPMHHDNLGSAFVEKARLDDAIACFRAALKVDPNDHAAHIKLGTTLQKKGLPDESIGVYRDAIRVIPDSALAHNNLAWLLATSPNLKSRDPAQALKLAQRAIELDPMNPTFPSTLGVAHYRAGDWKAAIVGLEQSMALRNGGDANEWLFLAMAHWQLCEKEEARRQYDLAVAWMDKNELQDEELRGFRAEAEELLEIKKK